jgi:hypothetical protein
MQSLDSSAPPLRSLSNVSGRARRRRAAFETLVNELESALLLAHEEFLDAREASPESPPDASWLCDLRIAAAIAATDAGDLGPDKFAVAARWASDNCRESLERARARRASTPEGRLRLRELVEARFWEPAAMALDDGAEAATAAFAAEANDDLPSRASDAWADREDILEVVYEDSNGRVWGTRSDGRPPLHVEHLNRREDEPRVRIDLEKKGVRAFEVVEGTLSDEDRNDLKNALLLRDELEDSWTAALLVRELVEMRKDDDGVTFYVYPGTPHAYEVSWRYEDLAYKPDAITGIPRLRIVSDIPALEVLYPIEWEERGAAERRLARLLFADVAPAHVIGWHGPETRRSRFHRDEMAAHQCRQARAAVDAAFLETLVDCWESQQFGAPESPPSGISETVACAAVMDLNRTDGSLAFVEAMRRWAFSTSTDELERRARRRLRAVAPFRHPGKTLGPLVFGDLEGDAFNCLWLRLDVETRPLIDDVDGFRLSMFWLDAIAPEWAGLGHAKLFASVGEFVKEAEQFDGYGDARFVDAYPYWGEDPPYAPEPRVMVSLASSWKETLHENAYVTISHDPQLSGFLPEPLASRVIDLVRTHREALLAHWHGKTGTDELADALAPTLRPATKEVP